MHPHFSVGPSTQRRGARVLSRRAGSSGISLRIHSLVKKTPHRHRADFEPQRASPFMKWVKAPKHSEKPPGLNDDPSLCATFYTAGGVGKLYQRRSTLLWELHCADHHLIRIGDERERLALGPQLGEAITRRAAS